MSISTAAPQAPSQRRLLASARRDALRVRFEYDADAAAAHLARVLSGPAPEAYKVAFRETFNDPDPA